MKCVDQNIGKICPYWIIVLIKVYIYSLIKSYWPEVLYFQFLKTMSASTFLSRKGQFQISKRICNRKNFDDFLETVVNKRLYKFLWANLTLLNTPDSTMHDQLNYHHYLQAVHTQIAIRKQKSYSNVWKDFR